MARHQLRTYLLTEPPANKTRTGKKDSETGILARNVEDEVDGCRTVQADVSPTSSGTMDRDFDNSNVGHETGSGNRKRK